MAEGTGRTFPDLIAENRKLFTWLFILIFSLLLIVGGMFAYVVNKNGLKGTFFGNQFQIGGISDTLSRANANAVLLKDITTQIADRLTDPVERDKFYQIAAQAEEVIASTNGMKPRLLDFGNLPPATQESILRKISTDYGLSVEIASKLNFGIVDKYVENEDLKQQLKALQIKLEIANEENKKLAMESLRNRNLANNNYTMYQGQKNRADSLEVEVQREKDSTAAARDKAAKQARIAQDAIAKTDETQKILDKTLPFSVSNLTIEKTRIANDKKMVVPEYKLKSGLKGSLTLKELTNKVDISSKQLEIVISRNDGSGIMPVSEPYIVPIKYDEAKHFQISAKKHDFSRGQYFLDLYLISGKNRLSIHNIELIVR